MCRAISPCSPTGRSSQIANADTLRRLQVGFDNFQLPQQIGPDVADMVRDDPFRANFVRLKTEHRLYGAADQWRDVPHADLVPGRDPDCPPKRRSAATRSTCKLFADGNMVARVNSAFEVVKVGFEQFVATAARDYGLLYGIATAMMALLTGWFASVVFRRD